MIEPLYYAMWHPIVGKLELPPAVHKRLRNTRYATWGVSSIEKLHYRAGPPTFRILLSNGQSTHPSDDIWFGIEIDEAGKIIREWREIPRKGPFEST